MRAFIVLSCLAFAAARPEAGYSYSRPSGGISSGSGISGSSFGIGHGGGSFGSSSFSSGGSSSLGGFGGVCLFLTFNKKKYITKEPRRAKEVLNSNSDTFIILPELFSNSKKWQKNQDNDVWDVESKTLKFIWTVSVWQSFIINSEIFFWPPHLFEYLPICNIFLIIVRLSICGMQCKNGQKRKY